MAMPPPQSIAITEVEYLSRALREATGREEYHKNLLQVSIGRYSKAEAEVRRLNEVCRGLKTNAGWWENMFNRAISTKKAEEAYFRGEERSRAKTEKALEEKVKLLQQHLYAKHVKPTDLPVTLEHIHIETLQGEVHDLLNKQERMEEELTRTTTNAAETLQHVTATVLALVAQVEQSQPGKMFDCHVKNGNVGRKRQRPAEVPRREDLSSSNYLEHSKRVCYESIRSAEAALVDATAVWKRARSEAEAMLTVGRKTILDHIFGRAEGREGFPHDCV